MLFQQNLLIGNNPDSIYNSLGHRCKELAEVNLRNHIIVLGDTAGLQLHLPVEETFPYLLSTKLEIDYYNLCVVNGGAEVVKYNLLTWLFKVAKPKAIILACEFVNSLLSTDLQSNTIFSMDLNNPQSQDLINNANYSGFFTARNFLFDRLLYHTNNIPIYQLVWENNIPLINEKVSNISCDNLDQKEISNILYEKMSFKFRAARNI